MWSWNCSQFFQQHTSRRYFGQPWCNAFPAGAVSPVTYRDDLLHSQVCPALLSARAVAEGIKRTLIDDLGGVEEIPLTGVAEKDGYVMADSPVDHQPADPPLEPFADSTTWFESGPAPVLENLGLAATIVRLGMVSNALTAQMQAGLDTRERSYSAEGRRDLMCSLVATAALTTEAIEVARQEMPTLKELMPAVSAPPDLLQRLGRLCSGNHPSAAFLSRARNSLGFHWDEEVIAKSLFEFGRNEKVVWLERTEDSGPVHRLSLEVTAYALFPEASAAGSDQDEVKKAVQRALSEMSDAIDLIVEAFAAATYGYFLTAGAVRRTTLTEEY